MNKIETTSGACRDQIGIPLWSSFTIWFIYYLLLMQCFFKHLSSCERECKAFYILLFTFGFTPFSLLRPREFTVIVTTKKATRTLREAPLVFWQCSWFSQPWVLSFLFYQWTGTSRCSQKGVFSLLILGVLTFFRTTTSRTSDFPSLSFESRSQNPQEIELWLWYGVFVVQ